MWVYAPVNIHGIFTPSPWPLDRKDRKDSDPKGMCYECGQTSHIQPNCSHLTSKVRMATIQMDSTVDLEIDPQDEENTSPAKEGEEGQCW